MKNFTSIFTFVALALMPFTFMGCDTDDDIADTLWGVWEGDMHVWSEWDGRVYEAHESVIQFDRNPYDYASGTGYWVDYYSGAPWDYFASRITWSVNDGVIRIYSYEDDTNFLIFDYSLSANYFTGTLQSEYGDPMDFRLYKTASPNWNDYEWGFTTWPGGSWPYGSYVSSRSTDTEKVTPKRYVGKKSMSSE